MLKLKKESRKLVKYVPVEQRCEERPFCVYMRPLSPLQKAEQTDKMSEITADGQMKITRANEVMLKSVLLQLAGWGNAVDEDGAVVDFDPSKGEANLIALGDEVVNQLVAVFGMGQHSEDAEQRLVDAHEKREAARIEAEDEARLRAEEEADAGDAEGDPS